MRLQSGRKFLAATGLATAGLIGAFTALPAAQDKPLLAEQVFKNVQVLKGIPVDDFLGTMGIMAAALQFDCSDCHVAAGTEKVDWAADTPRKQMARVMVTPGIAESLSHFRIGRDPEVSSGAVMVYANQDDVNWSRCGWSRCGRSA